MTGMLDVLKDAGIDIHVLGDRVAVMPFGGRIIGLYPDGKNNVIWTNQALNSASCLRSLLATEGWMNLGGDRTWISPEVETNLPEPESESAYDVQRSVDPAAYEVVECDSKSITLKTRMDVRFRRSRCTLPLVVTKKIAALEPDIALPEGVTAAGYALESSMRAEESFAEQVLPGLWNLLQVPGGGSVSVPVKVPCTPWPFIGRPEVCIDNDIVRCEVRTDASFKFGVHVAASRGLSFYTRSDGEIATLIVRKFSPCRNSRYGDVPSDDPSMEGYIHQVYIDDGTLGGFGEIEHHSPVLAVDNEISDRCETWAFVGPGSALGDIAARPCAPDGVGKGV